MPAGVLWVRPVATAGTCLGVQLVALDASIRVLLVTPSDCELSGAALPSPIAAIDVSRGSGALLSAQASPVWTERTRSRIFAETSLQFLFDLGANGPNDIEIALKRSDGVTSCTTHLSIQEAENYGAFGLAQPDEFGGMVFRGAQFGRFAFDGLSDPQESSRVIVRYDDRCRAVGLWNVPFNFQGELRLGDSLPGSLRDGKPEFEMLLDGATLLPSGGVVVASYATSSRTLPSAFGFASLQVSGPSDAVVMGISPAAYLACPTSSP